ncbi:hypothetical protein JCGZ_02189 [Jatropha curcas]|uniref:ERG2/sigma1 receptor-like protein n=1 Tax=Jatropha curcas TaxID=180498 RepID=A0A067KVG1_JATCU|nr:uncharacterized protein LOC105632005 [Jatropha curcas]KDP40191.1 hypothetical protein JCGZ_02189 [Jatropha curcas]
MKAHQSTPSSSAKSSTTTTTAMEERDSCYYPGCRKDANCNCEICIASINATLDLMPISIQKSSLTKLSTSRPNIERTPISFKTSILSTPTSNFCPKIESPVLKSTARLNFSEKETTKKNWCFGGAFLRFILGLCLIFAAELGFYWRASGVLKPLLSSDMVRKIGERSGVVQELNGRLRFLQNEFKEFVHDGKVSNCSHMDSIWKINQDGLLLNSRCVLYKSAMEELSVWGWPLQTAGLLKTGFASRSYTVLSGRVTEWSDGMIGYSIRKANSSWIHRKWGVSVVQLDPSTWVLEYGRSSVLDYSSLSSAVADLFMYQISRIIGRINQEFWLTSAFKHGYSGYTEESHNKIPT